MAAGSAQAATRVDLHALSVERMNSSYQAATRAAGEAATMNERHAEFLGLDRESSLQLLSSTDEANGMRHFRYQQTFRGIPVWGEHVVVSQQADGTVRTVFGRLVGDLAADLPVTIGARVTAASALNIAKGMTLGSRAAEMRTEREESRQMIYVSDDDRASLVYVVTYFADSAKGGTPTRPVVIVDAQTGAILKSFENLQTATIGTGPGGNAKTGQYQWGSGGKYGFLDVTQSGTTCSFNNADVKTVNLNGGTTGPTAFA